MEDIFGVIFKYIWVLIFIAGWVMVPIFLYRSYQSKRKREWYETQEFRLIRISVPKENDKGPLAAEQMFASLHGIFRPHLERKKEGSMQEHISFEIASSNEKISFYVWLPVHLKDFVEGQIYAQYPKAEFEEVVDYTERDFSDYHIVGTEIVLNKSEVFPIKTFMNFEEVDPLSGITSVLAKIDEPGEDIWIQILVKPMDDSWQERGQSYVGALREGRSPGSSPFGSKIMTGSLDFMKDLAKAAVTVPEPGAAGAPVKLKSGDEAKIKAIEEKISKLGYGVKIRVGYVTKKSNLAEAKIKLRSVIGSFKQFNTVNLNGFQAGSSIIGDKFLQDYRSRLFPDDGYAMNIEEVASIFHLPNVSVETPRISWTGSTKGAPPENLPIVEDDVVEINDIAPFAETNFRHRKYKFGIKTDDRRRHMYIIGKTGVGKTNMMNNMIISDIKAGHGIAVVDPHGELVSTILEHIPPERYDDVVLFDPADTEYPIAFNPLETVGSDQKQLIASGLISIFNKIWKESWGPRLEYILRNTILSLLDYPDSTLLGIPRILVDKQYRQAVVEKIQDPVIYDFWTKEFEQYNERTRSDAILPIQNKVGQFLSSPTIRNIVGQPKSSIDIREVMDKKKILLIRLSQGQIGEDNTALLGAMMITKMQLAAMSRVDVPEEERQDFFLYVDEFQNFATDSFAKILSEARKYRLNLTVANQYISQLSETVRDAIFGNVGSVVLFRVGAADSKFLAKEFEPVFEENDLVNLDKYHVYIKLAIDGVTGNAFSARTLKMPDKKVGDKDKIIALNRKKFSVKREDIEQSISRWSKEQMESVASQSVNTAQQSTKPEDTSYIKYSEYINNVKETIDSKDDSNKSGGGESAGSNIKVINNVVKEKPEVKEPAQDKHSKIKELTSKMITSQKHAFKEEKPVKEISAEEKPIEVRKGTAVAATIVTPIVDNGGSSSQNEGHSDKTNLNNTEEPTRIVKKDNWSKSQVSTAEQTRKLGHIGRIKPTQEKGPQITYEAEKINALKKRMEALREEPKEDKGELKDINPGQTIDIR